jgi:chromosome transmission fidelity protein 1
VRRALNDADIICVPYNLLLQQSSREAIGLNLRESIVIIDEAHNVIEAINSIHSCLLDETQIKKCLEQLHFYFEKYKSKFKGKTTMYIRQLIFILKQFSSCLELFENSCIMSIKNLIDKLKIEHFNLFKLHSFIKESRLSSKLHGLSEQARKKEMKSNGDVFISNHEIPLRIFDQFLTALNRPDTDGRVLVTNKPGVPKCLHYILLNPSELFEPIIKEARSVILAGGTISPICDFLEQVFFSLFPVAPVHPKR